jgi:hypothetical protein
MRGSRHEWLERLDGRAGATPTIRAEGSDLTYDCLIVNVYAHDGSVPSRRGTLVLRCRPDGTITARLAPRRRSPMPRFTDSPFTKE